MHNLLVESGKLWVNLRKLDINIKQFSNTVGPMTSFDSTIYLHINSAAKSNAKQKQRNNYNKTPLTLFPNTNTKYINHKHKHQIH